MLNTFLFSFLCFFLTSLGAASIFLFKKINNKLEAFLHAFAAGVMIASSIFSLIIPAMDYCTELGLYDYLILPGCFLLALFVYLILEKINKSDQIGKINTFRVGFSIALHNIPEGMCVGFAFAMATTLGTESALASAIMIAIGIGIQNIPEGSSVAFPLYSAGKSKTKAFLTSAAIGFIEVPAAIIAYLIGLRFLFILPYMLSFSAAIMIIVAACELMPEASTKHTKISTISFFAGFFIMMLLDLALG